MNAEGPGRSVPPPPGELGRSELAKLTLLALSRREMTWGRSCWIFSGPDATLRKLVAPDNGGDRVPDSAPVLLRLRLLSAAEN